MRSLLLPLLLLSAPALADGELQLQSGVPVILILDGETVGTVQPLEPLLIDITPGVHNLKLQGMLGKDLYDRDLIFDDHTRTELHWQSKELRLGQVVALDPDRKPDDASVAAAEPAPSAPAAEAPPPVEVAAAAPAPVAPVPAPPAVVAAPTPPPVVTAPPALAAAPVAVAPALAVPVAPAAAVAPAVAAAPQAVTPVHAGAGSVVVQATPNLDLRIVHGTQQLRVRVQNGELVVVDAHGTEVHFPGGAPTR